MKTLATNILFWMYFFLILVAIGSYIAWLTSLDQTDTTFEITIFIVIITTFILSQYTYYEYDTITCLGVLIFLEFASVMAHTFADARIETSKINRRAAYVLGMMSIAPVLTSYILNHINSQ
jgi:hypothetical protein